MRKTIAHLGPKGTYSELATLCYAQLLQEQKDVDSQLIPVPSISQTLMTVAQEEADIAIVPIENSIEGTVVITLDTLWELDNLHIQQALTIPIVHNLLSRGRSLSGIKTVYSHPQALAQCQKWLASNLPDARLIATNSTTEALHYLKNEPTSGAISSLRAAQMYDLPVKEENINDYDHNCTRFLVVSRQANNHGNHVSLGLSFKDNMPGVLIKPLQIFAERSINLTKIESRPDKYSLGDYLFFVDLKGNPQETNIRDALDLIKGCSESLKIFGNYDITTISRQQLATISNAK